MDLQLNNKRTDSYYGVLNLVMLISCITILLFYIVQINRFVSSQYKIDVLKNKFSSILEEQQKLQAEKFKNDGIPQVVQFARKTGMLESGNSVFIFEEGSLAKR